MWGPEEYRAAAREEISTDMRRRLFEEADRIERREDTHRVVVEVRVVS